MRHAQSTFIVRAGLWKPRTSPHSFHGVGAEGLPWLQAVQQETGLPVATEVATPEQVQLALQAGIDYLWIGARTGANPIAVENLIRSAQCTMHDARLKGIFIKNPVNEDTALWIGNIERLETLGVPVMAVHRGCGHRPCWRMPYTLRQQRPDIPILLDPSHMSGDAQQVPPLCEQAARLGLDGLMVEVHNHPEQALSDAKQQLSADALSVALTRYESQPEAATNRTEPYQLVWLRAMMDEVDDRLWACLRERMNISREIGTWKHEHGVGIVQKERFEHIRQQRLAEGKKAGISEEMIEAVLKAIHEESVRMQS